MTVRRRKKVARLRGSGTYGYGIKKHRGAGNRGGRGRAGMNNQKKSLTIKLYKGKYYGGHGFVRSTRKVKPVYAINIENLPQQQSINLRDMGYTKLLAKGTPKMKHEIIVDAFSKKAKEKIEKAGGTIKK
ncbi:MAG: uL15 family ribosomal protein [Nanoarchaeota archaeon]